LFTLVETYHRRVEPEMSAWYESLATLLRVSRFTQPSALPEVINEAVRPLGVEVTVYLIDREQVTMRALPQEGRPEPDPLPVDTTVGGRAFTTQQVVVPPGQADRLWLPVVDDSERLGAMEVRLPAPLAPDDPSVREGAELLSLTIGELLVSKSAYGDTIRRTRRSRVMSTEGEMLWRTLPPLTCVTGGLTLAAALEPCYEVGGDAFDYAIDYSNLRMNIFDAVGHGLTAALTSSLTLAATRAARAAGYDLTATAAAADQAITGQFSDSRYTTAILAELDTTTGQVQYVNAGHPPPVLIREGKVVITLDATPRTPLGIPEPAKVTRLDLQPGDRLFFYTDGITEARNRDGEFFGLDRLLDLAERHAAGELPAPETLRRLVRAVLAYQEGTLEDDGTLMIVEWHPGAG
jgi:phosphoserine phosphatase RsbU/P